MVMLQVHDGPFRVDIQVGGALGEHDVSSHLGAAEPPVESPRVLGCILEHGLGRHQTLADSPRHGSRLLVRRLWLVLAEYLHVRSEVFV